MKNGSVVASLSKRTRLLRAPIVIGVLLASVVALWAGLVRIGWRLPETSTYLLLAHGPLMVCALMTLIGLERAAALQGAQGEWPFAAPMLSALGVVCLIAGLPPSLSALLVAIGSAALVVVYVVIIRIQPAAFTRTMAAGAVLLLAGNGLWLIGWPVFRIAPWWVGFLVLTIAGERLELGRVQRLPTSATRAFATLVIWLCAGVVLSAFAPDLGVRLMGLGLLALAAWLLRYDIARRTIRTSGLPKFVAACLLSGYVWLGVGGALALAFGAVSTGLRYDAVLHTVFVGFVFSMIFGHAPIIVPAVLGVAIAPLKQFYVPLALLHASLTARILGDLFGSSDLRRWGGLLNAVALVTYAGLMIYAAHSARRHRQRVAPHEESKHAISPRRRSARKASSDSPGRHAG
jgi:hypothetical protein